MLHYHYEDVASFHAWTSHCADLQAEGARRTPYNERELLRRTLRLHLREVIEQDSVAPSERLTNIAPWPRGALNRALKRADKRCSRIEAAATAAQARPSSDD